MTPSELDDYDLAAKTRLTSTQKLPDGEHLKPYTKLELEVPEVAPYTFVSLFVWTPKVEQQRLGWEKLIQGHKLAANITHPKAAVMQSTFKLDDDFNLVPGLASQYYAKMRRSVAGNIVFTDVDVVAYRPCDPFQHDFDVGLTDCADQWPSMPFNAGVMFARDTPKAQEFYDTAMEATMQFPANMNPWYAYQVGLRTAYDMLKHRVNFRTFPHALFNYVPEIVAPTDAYFVHLKGQRKNMMREYIVPVLEGKIGR